MDLNNDIDKITVASHFGDDFIERIYSFVEFVDCYRKVDLVFILGELIIFVLLYKNPRGRNHIMF